MVGTVPIVHDDGIFDMRLFDGTDAWITSHPSEVGRDFDARYVGPRARPSSVASLERSFTRTQI